MVLNNTVFGHMIDMNTEVTKELKDWVSTDRHHLSNQIYHFTIISRFGLLKVCNNRIVDIGFGRDHHLSFYARIAYTIYRSFGELRVPKFNIDSLIDLVRTRQWGRYLTV